MQAKLIDAWRWPTIQVGGQEFVKGIWRPVEIESEKGAKASEWLKVKHEKVASVNATPKAASLAVENNIDLSVIVGSGEDGKVLVSDVKKAKKALDDALEIDDLEVPKELEDGTLEIGTQLPELKVLVEAENES